MIFQLQLQSMFIEIKKPKDYACGYNLDLMIEALPRITDAQERLNYANRIVGLIKQSHINWVDENGDSRLAWDHFFELAPYNLNEYGIFNPFENGSADMAE